MSDSNVSVYITLNVPSGLALQITHHHEHRSVDQYGNPVQQQWQPPHPVTEMLGSVAPVLLAELLRRVLESAAPDYKQKLAAAVVDYAAGNPDRVWSESQLAALLGGRDVTQLWNAEQRAEIARVLTERVLSLLSKGGWTEERIVRDAISEAARQELASVAKEQAVKTLGDLAPKAER